MQVDLGDALGAGFRQRPAGAAPDTPESIEANRYRGRSRPVGRQNLPDEVEQQVDLQFETHEIRMGRRVLVLLLGRTVLFHRIPRLQQLDVAIGKGRGHFTVGRVRRGTPLHGEHRLESQLLVEHYCVGAVEHASLHDGGLVSARDA